MCKSEIFAEILEAVSRETEVSAQQILSDSKQMEVVDARYLLVHFLSRSGFYPSFIAEQIHKTKRAVNYILTNFKARLDCGKMMRIQYENIQKWTGNN